MGVTAYNGAQSAVAATRSSAVALTKGGKWTEKLLYGFKGVAPGEQFGDGANPNGELIIDSKGTIYGRPTLGVLIVAKVLT